MFRESLRRSSVSGAHSHKPRPQRNLASPLTVPLLLMQNSAPRPVHVAAGLYAPVAGQVIINHALIALSGPGEARSRGIGMVHQHFKLVMPFTVAENILLTDGMAIIAPESIWAP